MSQQSPIFIKTEAFMVWLFQHTTKFPRHERFRLAQRIEEALFGFHACLVRATASDKPQVYLTEADIQLNLLRAYLRLAVELKYTTPQQYQHASAHTSEIGRLLGGWLRRINEIEA